MQTKRSLLRDKIVTTNLLLRLIGIFSQLVIIYSIGNLFNKADQGYYYILNSIAGISVFFELGFGLIVMQHAAKQYSRHDNKKKLIDNLVLISLLKYVNQFYLITSLIYITSVCIYSFNYFTVEQFFKIKYPLYILTLASAFKIYFDGNLSFFDGCGKMAFTTKIRIGQTLFLILSYLLLLKLQTAPNIYIYPVSLLTSYLLILFFIKFSQTTIEYKIFFFKIFYKNNKIKSILWFNRIFKHQIKISISWISGYFITQIPLLFLFKFLGPESSGKYGFTVNLLTSITNLSLIFIHTINPKLAYFTSIKDYDSLNNLFNERVKTSMIINSIFILGFWIFKLVIIDNYQILFNDRFLSNQSILILTFMTYLGIFTSSISCYVRSNREEPLMYNSIATAVIVFLCSILIIKNSSVDSYILYSSIIIFLVETPWFLKIYLRYKNKVYIK